MTLNLNLLTDGESCHPEQLSPLTLAFIGDAVFDLLVREMLVREANRPVGKLHSLKADRVRACSQAEGIRWLTANNLLSDEELTVLKRGRNAHTNRTPKGASEADYHLATACEALFGYLYLGGKSERIYEIFELMCHFYDNISADESNP